jgi:adenosylmethionine-8-amino-7-oxononanoate aminotransferase
MRSTLAALDHRHIWHPFTQGQEWVARDPLIIQSAKGVWLKTVDGRRLLDGNSSLWVNVWGHRHPVLDAALKRQIDRISHCTFLGLTHEPAIRLAKKLVDIAPRGLTRVFYSDNGSTAVEVALKMAYQYWQLKGRPKKNRFLSLKEGYHGDTIGAVSVGGVELFHRRFKRLLFDGWQGNEANFLTLLRRHHRSLAAVVMEPLIQGASGMLLMSKGFLKKVERLCKELDVFLIVDEVATGFGRTGTMFAVEQENVHPDFLCVAKSLTGGYLPLAATLTSERVYRAFLGRYDEFKTFFHGHTYTANPLACAVAIANLDLYRKKNLLQNVRARARQLQIALKPLLAHPHVKEIRQRGLMAGIELVADKKTGRPFKPSQRMGLKVCQAAIERGVWLRPLGDVIVLLPPLAISETELYFLTNALRRAMEFV